MEEFKNEMSPIAGSDDQQETPSAIAEKGESEGPLVRKTPEETELKARLIMGGLVAAALVSVVAVLVAGIFQLSTLWLSCKPNLPVSDPARAHWNELISEKITTANTGVPKKLEDLVKLRGLAYSKKAEEKK
jgi:hypothetical protein